MSKVAQATDCAVSKIVATVRSFVGLSCNCTETPKRFTMSDIEIGDLATVSCAYRTEVGNRPS